MRFVVAVLGTVGLALALAACQPVVHVFGVDTAADGVDAVPGDGRCATAVPERCTLRAAVMEANALGEHTQVLLPAGAVTLSIGSGDENDGVADDLDVRVPLTLTGDPESGSTVDAGGVGRVLDVISGTTTVTRVELRGGSTTASGAGVQVRGGATLTADEAAITANSSSTGTGGLKVLAGGTVTLTRSTVSANTGSGNGGVVNAGTLTMTNSTVAGNASTDGTGGGVATPAGGATTLKLVTVTANTGSGLDGDGTVTLVGSVVADQVGTAADCTGVAPVSAGRNLDGDGTCLVAPAAGDVVSGSANLGPLGANGGLTATVRPGTGSAARDAIPAGTVGLCDGSVTTDQRGRVRPTFGACDMGAVETGDLTVNRSDDGVDVAPGDGFCEVTAGHGDCTLRAAIGEANATPGSQEVQLQSDVTLSRAGIDDTNVNGDLDVTDALVVHGDGHTVDAGGFERVLHAKAALVVDRLTVTGGSVSGPGAGGGILATADLTLRFVTVQGNSTEGNGGGIAHTAGHLVVEDSTIADNTITAAWASVAGGGIRSSGASATIVRSTISGNDVQSTSGGGGGVSRAGAPAAISWSTIRDNRAGRTVIDPVLEDGSGYRAGAGGGGVSGPVTLTASTVSGNWSGGDGGGLAGSGITVRSSTITGNHAWGGSWDNNAMIEFPSGKGGAVYGTATVVASTIVGNDAWLSSSGISGGSISGSIHTDSCAPAVGSGGWNVVAGGCPQAGPGDVVVPAEELPVVAPLADNGGATRTMVPVGSVLDTIPPGTAGLCDATATVDQRGRPRPVGAACDSGSVEPSAVASVTLVTNDGGDARDQTPGDGLCATAAGTCTLRAAIDEANLSVGADTITLGVDTTLTRGGIGEDANATGDLDIGTDLTIEGGGHRVDGGNIDRVLHQRSGNLVLNAVTVRRGALHGADRLGGLVLSSSGGSLTIAGSTLADGAAGPAGRGGAILKQAGSLSVSASTITGVTAGTGAALALDDGTATLTHVTVASDGGASALAGGGISVSRSIVAAPAGTACATPLASTAWNLVTDASCGGALVADPLLGPLAANGGPTPTRLPAAGSPAINVAPVGEVGACDATAPADQRGVARPQGSGCDVGATEDDDGSVPTLPTLVVDRTTDVHDVLPGDGVCAVAGGGCTLRAAVDEANARPGTERIELTVDVTLALPGRVEDLNAGGDLDVRSPVVLDGGGHQIAGGGLDRVLDLFQPAAVADVVITGGLVTDYASQFGYGGGIRTRADLTLERSELVGNQATQVDGGGLAVTYGTYSPVAPAPVVLVVDSTFEGNVAPNGAAIRSATVEPVTVARSTVSGNQGYSALDGPAHVVASTFAGNVGTTTLGQDIDVRGSIVSAHGPACNQYGRPVSLGYNVADSSCGFFSEGDHTYAELPLTPLADHGGPTRTHLAYNGLPVVDTIPAGTPGLCEPGAVDQRGVARPTGAGCDLGAVEGDAGAWPADQLLVVNTGLDQLDAAPGDGVCATAAGTCSLRAAVEEANRTPGPARIQLQANVTLSRAGAGEDANLTGDLDITDRTRIDGADRFIDGAGLDRVLHVRDGPLNLVRVQVRNGGTAGGVRVDDGFLDLDRSTVSGNAGTGIVLERSASVLRASTVSGNTGGAGAGGLSVVQGWLRLERSTVSGNSGSGGAGIASAGGHVALVRSTIAANSGSASLTWTYATTSFTVGASVLQGGPAAVCGAALASLGWNAVSDTSCGLAGAGDQQGVAIVLAPLAANGGPTKTHLLATGSTLVDGVPMGTPFLCDATSPSDQRGVARPAGAGCDIGAVEGSTTVAPGADPPAVEEGAPEPTTTLPASPGPAPTGPTGATTATAAPPTTTTTVAPSDPAATGPGGAGGAPGSPPSSGSA